MREFRKEARRIRGAAAGRVTKASRDVDASAGANGGATDVGANVRRVGEAIGRGVSDAAASVSQAAGGLVASATSKASDLGGGHRAGGDDDGDAGTGGESASARDDQGDGYEGVDRSSDDADEESGRGVGGVGFVGGEFAAWQQKAIHEEVKLQAKLVEDLEADFSHTSDRMRKLRKQGFKLAGEKNEEAREKIDKEEALAEMRRKTQAQVQGARGGQFVRRAMMIRCCSLHSHFKNMFFSSSKLYSRARRRERVHQRAACRPASAMASSMREIVVSNRCFIASLSQTTVRVRYSTTASMPSTLRASVAFFSFTLASPNCAESMAATTPADATSPPTNHPSS